MEVQVQRGDVLLRSEKVWEFFTRHGGEEGHTLQCGVVALVESYCATMTSALERLDMSDGQRREASALLEYMQGMDRRQQAAQEAERGAVAECVGAAVPQVLPAVPQVLPTTAGPHQPQPGCISRAGPYQQSRALLAAA